MSEPIIDVCEVCEGSGKIRANYKNEAGKFVMNKETCYACEGRGTTEYVKCSECGSMRPVHCEDAHTCSD